VRPRTLRGLTTVSRRTRGRDRARAEAERGEPRERSRRAFLARRTARPPDRLGNPASPRVGLRRPPPVRSAASSSE
jgi:hypothetical protein